MMGCLPDIQHVHDVHVWIYIHQLYKYSDTYIYIPLPWRLSTHTPNCPRCMRWTPAKMGKCDLWGKITRIIVSWLSTEGRSIEIRGLGSEEDWVL